MESGALGPTKLLQAEDLLAGSKAIFDIEIPPAVLSPSSNPSPAPDHKAPEKLGSAWNGVRVGCVRLRPLNVATLSLISRASRENPELVPLLMVKEALVEPALSLEQVRQLHLGLVYYLVAQVNQISGLSAEGEILSQQAASSPLGQTHLLLAQHFGWTPEQVSQLTPGQVAVYLAGIERLLNLRPNPSNGEEVRR